MGETVPRYMVEETLHRVILLITDEMIATAWNVRVDLRGIRDSAADVIQLLQSAGNQEEDGWEWLAPLKEVEEGWDPIRKWLAPLKEVASEAEDDLDVLSYQILQQKVHNSFGRILFLKQVSFDSKVARGVENLNLLLHKIKNDAMNFGLKKISSDRMMSRIELNCVRAGVPYFDVWPSCLKSCFAFCLTFPNNFRIQKRDLIQLWMAEGLVDTYDEGNVCFIAFLDAYFLRVAERDEDGNVVSCTIICLEHGLLDHVQSKSETFSRLEFLYAKTSTSAISDIRAKKLRTLILDGVLFHDSCKLESLRTIVFLNNADMEELPSSIWKLKHLRHLDVSNTRIRALPEFITKLYNLQTLKFLHCKELNKLPRKKFTHMIGLKNIAFSFEHQMPFGLGQLKGLEMLSLFVVGSDAGGSIKELECLNKLSGHLDITRLEEVRDKKEAKGANLHQKSNLYGLSLQWSYGENDRSSSDEELLEGLRPHPNIKRIKIKYYMGGNWPLWMLRTKNPSEIEYPFVINNLVSLTLESCWNCEQLPSLGDLPCLKFLSIQHMKRAKYIVNEFYERIDDEEADSEEIDSGCLTLFPALESLSLSWMENLTNWSSTERPLNGNKVVLFPRLKTLSIRSCAKLNNFPMNDLLELVKLDIQDCDELRFLFRAHHPFPSLTSLSIVGCPKLTKLQNWLLSRTSYNEFRVRRCEWINFIPTDMGMQRSLVSLEINCCKGLILFSEEILCKLTQLKKLSIGAFSEELDDFRYLNHIKQLSRLEELEIWGSDFVGRQMSHLPDQLQHLNGLVSLKIKGFTTMGTLPDWLTNLQSLHYLSLNYCWHLEYHSTFRIIKQLSSLNDLYIYGCHHLVENRKINIGGICLHIS